MVVNKMETTRVSSNVIPCIPQDLDVEGTALVRLPRIPIMLPDLPRTSLRQDALSQETKLVKIAGLSDRIIGLTNKGHILQHLLNPAQEGQWEYVCLTCRSL